MVGKPNRMIRQRSPSAPVKPCVDPMLTSNTSDDSALNPKQTGLLMPSASKRKSAHSPHIWSLFWCTFTVFFLGHAYYLQYYVYQRHSAAASAAAAAAKRARRNPRQALLQAQQEQQQQQHSLIHVNANNNNKKRLATHTRRFEHVFVLHMGPPRTGAPTLQAALTSFAEALWQDGFTYQGKFFHASGSASATHSTTTAAGSLERSPVGQALFDLICQRQSYQLRHGLVAASSMETVLVETNHTDRSEEAEVEPACWHHGLRQSLQDLAGKHVIVSDETLSHRTIPMEPNLIAALDWQALQETLADAGWDLLVVLSYRRLWQRVMGIKLQRDSYSPAKPRLVQWPGGPGGGRSLEPWFPELLQESLVYKTLRHRPRHDVMDVLPDHVPVALLNTHPLNDENEEDGGLQEAPWSTRSTLLCQVLSSQAPLACDASRLADEQQQHAARWNQTASLQQQPDNHDDDDDDDMEILALHADALATAAAAEGWIDTQRFTRRDVGLAIQKRVLLQRRQQQHVDNKWPWPLACPVGNQMTKLLEASLLYEKDVSHFLSPDDSDEAAAQRAHEDEFWEAVTRQRFCWIDTAKTLQQEEWIAFFRPFAVSWSDETPVVAA